MPQAKLQTYHCTTYLASYSPLELIIALISIDFHFMIYAIVLVRTAESYECQDISLETCIHRCSAQVDPSFKRVFFRDRDVLMSKAEKDFPAQTAKSGIRTGLRVANQRAFVADSAFIKKWKYSAGDIQELKPWACFVPSPHGIQEGKFLGLVMPVEEAV